MCSLRGGFMEPELEAGGGAIAAPAPIMPLNYRPKRGKSSPWASSEWPIASREEGVANRKSPIRHSLPAICRFDQRRQLPHVVECDVRAGGTQFLGMAGQAMAAAMKAQHRHVGGARAR